MLTLLDQINILSKCTVFSFNWRSSFLKIGIIFDIDGNIPLERDAD